ncbi:MAG: LysR family transcriptional regulator [Pseudomonadota bacterium]
MRINFDFSDLEAFTAVFETGSFQLASRRIHVSQSAITRRVRKLEEALGSSLFERTTRSVRPTLAAKRLYARAQTMLADAEEITLAMRDETLMFTHQRNALVTISAVPTVIASWLAPAIQQFRTDGNHARIRILDDSANEVGEAVSQGASDFGLCPMPSQEPQTEFEPCFSDRLIALMPQKHELASKLELTWEELSDQDIIVPAQGTGNRVLIDDAMARLRIPLRWAFEARRSTTSAELAKAGLGIALLPNSAVEMHAGNETVIRPIAGPDILRPIGLVTRTGQTHSRAATQLIAALRACAPDRETDHV